MKIKTMYFFSAAAIVAIAVISLSFVNTGTLVTDATEQPIASFKNISVGGSYQVYVSNGPTTTLKMEGDADDLAKTSVSVEAGTLIIEPKKENTNIKGTVKIYVSTPELGRVDLGGSGLIKLENKFTNTSSMDISLAGSGEIEGDISSPDVDAEIAGSGTITLSGDAKDLDVDIAGSGSFKGKDFSGESVDVDIAGSGDAYVQVTSKLNVDIAGSGNVYYSGSPAITRDIAGSGDIIKN